MCLTLCTWLLCSLHLFAFTKAEVTCASCPLPAHVKTGDVQNNARTISITEDGKSLVSFTRTRWLPVLEGVSKFGKDMNDAPNSTEVAVETVRNTTVSGATPHPQQITLGRPRFEKGGKKGSALPRRKRSAAQLDEFGASARSGDSAESTDAMLFVDGQKLRRNRDEGKMPTSRSEEPKVSSSTFALAGDSAHNHAVVYWTGHNSSSSVWPDATLQGLISELPWDPGILAEVVFLIVPRKCLRTEITFSPLCFRAHCEASLIPSDERN
ncbi:VPS10 domain-containing receptor SorCS1 [Bagarius yarrelli]|uniref:VPS10 domain-containing receptor SorCS1 n=1 Tax=Bagarius yarrelli TaxID=175774 RepID=A0A556TKM6_BAGYA|nr:VPS10 domain-containing receptor SorCS1 [Bagarius yarrelli]